MKRIFIVLLAAAVFFATCAISCAYKITDDVNLNVNFLEQFRSETWDTFDNGAPDKDDGYTFMSSKMRLGIGATSKFIDAYTQFQWTQLINLPDDAMYGTGGLYYKQNNGSRNVGYVCLSQGWIKGRMPGFEALSVRLGRFLYKSGLEPNTLPKNKTLAWLKKKRISQRLIGPFDWSRIGRGYDGVQAAYNDSSWNLTFSAMHPTPGGFYLKRDQASKNGYTSNDIDMITVAATMKDSVIQGMDSQVFYYYYNDHRGLYEDGMGDADEISTFGGHILYNTPKIGPGSFDLLAWGAYQTGTYSSQKQRKRLDQGGYAIALEGGYKFSDIMWQPWIRGGYFRGSGDDDPTDNDHDTFFMMIPTLRVYAMTPFYNLMNTTYGFGQLIFKPLDKLVVRSDVTRLWLTKDNDAWYQGSGMTRADQFGYGAKTAHIGRGHDSLGTMWDISFFIKDIYNYMGASLGMNLYYSHVFGDDVIEDNFPEDEDMNFFYVEGIIKF